MCDGLVYILLSVESVQYAVDDDVACTQVQYRVRAKTKVLHLRYYSVLRGPGDADGSKEPILSCTQWHTL